MINFEKFTNKAREALSESQRLAASMGHQAITIEHLVLALISQPDGVVPSLLDQMGTDRTSLEAGVRQLLLKYPQVSGSGIEPRLSEELQRVLESAVEIASRFADDYVSSEHLFMAAVQSPGSLASLFRSLRLDPQGLLSSLKVVRGHQKQVHDGPYTEAKDIVGGFSIVEARDIEQAVELSRGCPILDGGGSVEVRPVMAMNM